MKIREKTYGTFLIWTILGMFVFLLSFLCMQQSLYAAETTGWIKENQKISYWKNGSKVTGMQLIGGQIYYFNKDGVLKTGRTKVSGKTYYFTPSGQLGTIGRMKLGWVKENGKDYFYSEKGTVGTRVKVKSIKGNYKKGSSPYGTSLSKSQLNAVKKAVTTFMKKEVATNMSEAEKVVAAHDYILDRTAFKTSSNYKKMKYNTAYGALVKKKAQCEGYSRAMKALCDAMGVKCIVVKSTNISHTWNMIRVNKKYYHLDAQMDDDFLEERYVLCLVGDKERKIGGIKWSKKHPKCPSDYPFSMKVPGINRTLYW